MLENLHLKNVGPAPEMDIQFTERLNLITGDNGLGKSFLLDVAWWALTQTWARGTVVPHSPPAAPQIAYRFGATYNPVERAYHYNRRSEQWWVQVNQSRLATGQTSTEMTGLVLYAQVDGGFSVYDSTRNSGPDIASPSSSLSPMTATNEGMVGKSGSPNQASDRSKSYRFSPSEVWDGNNFCEGLIRDWASWQREGGEAYAQLLRALRKLSPSAGEKLEAGELRRIALDDPKSYPTLRMPYGEEVAVIHASAGIRRIIALAYLLVWAWQEHIAACRLIGEAPAKQIIFLIDEVEAHLHPQWQRRIVPAILEVMDAITGEHRVDVQLIATTHSPLVLASTESRFDPAKDSWFDLDLDRETHAVVLQKRPFVRQGDYSNWLKSEAFDLKEARSLEAEEAITAALAILREPAPDRAEVERVNDLLSAALSDTDRFWMRWSEFYEKTAAA